MAELKLYNVDQAEKTLPLVRRIVRDIVDAFTQHAQAEEARRALAPNPTPGSDTEQRAFKHEDEAQDAEQRLLRCQKELADMGVELKDFREGLIDFYSDFDDRLVFICWKLSDGDKISWWHEINAGFRGRQAITPENRGNFKGGRAQILEA